MIYLQSFTFPSEDREAAFFCGNPKAKKTCYDSKYPFGLFRYREFSEFFFDDITVFYGNNGSGKSTILNVIAEKLGLPQVTYAEEIISVADGKATIKRRLERGVETVTCPLPLVVTVNGSADECRPRNARLIQKYKYAKSPSEKAECECARLYDERDYLNIAEWSVNDVDADLNQVGMAGSPTKVKTVENVVFQAKESKRLDGTDAEIDELIQELIANHTIG